MTDSPNEAVPAVIADRIRRAQSMQPGMGLDLRGQEPPTPAQVAAVLRAMADHAMWQMWIAEARRVGTDRGTLGPDWALLSGIGRVMHGVADDFHFEDVIASEAGQPDGPEQ